MAIKRPISTREIRKQSVFLGKGEQGEVRSFLDIDPSGKFKSKLPWGSRKLGEVVKTIYQNALYRPRTFFNVWLTESRDIRDLRKLKLQRDIQNIASVLFSGQVLEINGIRFPKKFNIGARDLTKLSEDEILPELYLPRVDEPMKLVRLKKAFYANVFEVQERAARSPVEIRERLYAESMRVRLKFDADVRAEYPQIVKLEEEIEAAGFTVMHPEINFGIRDGKIVFYDLLPRIDLKKLNAYLQRKKLDPWQRSIINLRLRSIERLGFSEEEMHGRRKFLFANIKQNGQKILEGAFKRKININSQVDLHKEFDLCYYEDFFKDSGFNNQYAFQKLTYLIEHGEIMLNGRKYIIEKLSDGIIFYLDLPKDLLNEITTTDIGMPVFKIPLIGQKGKRVYDLSAIDRFVYDLGYLIKNKLIPEEQIAQLVQ